MIIHQNFIGGNITVKGREGRTIYLENQLRDTNSDWFYWAFCVENAEEGEFVFKFDVENRVGYYGAAVSTDLKSWRWLGNVDGESFKYTFSGGEKLYFAHHMLYHPERFSAFLESASLSATELCKSRRGRSVPCVRLGDGEISVVLTARHHACESTGSYVLEGVLRELIESPIENTRIFCVPFVDYDGVVDGDQGKCRAPYDHNRDYTDAPIYPETAAIMDYMNKEGCNFGFDFHAPYHKVGENDFVFIVRNNTEKIDKFDWFSDALESEITDRSMKYDRSSDIDLMTRWNQPSPNFGYTTNRRPECNLALTLESCYFGCEDNIVSQDRLVELGRCFARAIKKYIEGYGKQALC